MSPAILQLLRLIGKASSIHIVRYFLPIRDIAIIQILLLLITSSYSLMSSYFFLADPLFLLICALTSFFINMIGSILSKGKRIVALVV